MRDETRKWFQYAEENFASARLLLHLPSKYPIGSVLADYEPDETICREAISIAERALLSAGELIG